MTNISLRPGSGGGLEELISDTRDGIYLETNRSWSIDDRRLNFQFGTQVGWLIKNGRRTTLVRNPTYTGITPTFWAGCDAIADASSWVQWGVPNCGKGEPMQTGHVGHGASPARDTACGGPALDQAGRAQRRDQQQRGGGPRHRQYDADAGHKHDRRGHHDRLPAHPSDRDRRCLLPGGRSRGRRGRGACRLRCDATPGVADRGEHVRQVVGQWPPLGDRAGAWPGPAGRHGARPVAWHPARPARGCRSARSRSVRCAAGSSIVVPRRKTFYGADEVWVRTISGHVLGLSQFTS